MKIKINNEVIEIHDLNALVDVIKNTKPEALADTKSEILKYLKTNMQGLAHPDFEILDFALKSLFKLCPNHQAEIFELFFNKTVYHKIIITFQNDAWLDRICKNIPGASKTLAKLRPSPDEKRESLNEVMAAMQGSNKRKWEIKKYYSESCRRF